MRTKITTDWHLSVRRMAGTTPESQGGLREYLRASLANQLDDTDHLIAGDLLHDFTIDTAEMMEIYSIFATWLYRYDRKLALLRGNHDYSMRGAQASSFDLLGLILKERFPNQVTVADEVTEWKQFVLVPHLPNNDELDLAVSKLSGVTNKVVVFHANVDNFHAADSQHSLNLSMEQIEDLVSRGNLVLCGHEHQYRSLVGGKCVVLGNTAPSSVADCIGSPKKYAWVIDDNGLSKIETWSADEHFLRVDWRDLDNVGDYDFIRVEGTAKAEEAALVVDAIAKFRGKHTAYVISNAVQIDGQEGLEEAAQVTFDNVKGFDVMSALLAELEPEERKVIEGVMG